MKWLSVFKHIKCIHCCRRHCCLAWAYPRSPTIQSKWFNLLFILLKILHRVSRILIISNQNRERKNVHTMPAQIGFGNFSSKPQQRSLHYCNISLHLHSTPSITYIVNGDPLKYYIVSMVMNCKTAQSNANIWRCFVLLKCGAPKRQWILIELKQINASGHNETRTRRIKEPKSPANQLANAFSLAHSPFQPIWNRKCIPTPWNR